MNYQGTFSEIFGGFLGKTFHECLGKVFFPDELKCAEVVPVYKKFDKEGKNNNRPVSTLSNISKLYERSMHQQINKYFESFL